MPLTPTAAVNAAIASARGLPSLIANLSAINPALARQLTAKPLLLAKSPPAVLLGYGIAWLSGRYGFGWDADTCALVAGVVIAAVAYAMRAITTQPIAGIVRVPDGVPPEVAIPEATTVRAGIPVLGPDDKPI